MPPALTLLLGLAAMWAASQIPAGRLPHDPGPALLPFAAGIALVLVSAYTFWRRDPHEHMPRGTSLVRLLVTLALAFAYALLIEPLGFPTATFLFLLAEMWLIGVRRLLVAVPLALALSVGVYALFRYGLEVPLPGVQIGGVVL